MYLKSLHYYFILRQLKTDNLSNRTQYLTKYNKLRMYLDMTEIKHQLFKCSESLKLQENIAVEILSQRLIFFYLGRKEVQATFYAERRGKKQHKQKTKILFINVVLPLVTVSPLKVRFYAETQFTHYLDWYLLNLRSVCPLISSL